MTTGALVPATRAELEALVVHLRSLALTAGTDTEARVVTSRIAAITRSFRVAHGIGLPAGPVEQAAALDPGFVPREHLAYLSGRLTAAVADVERGANRMLAVGMPPRAGKSTTLSLYSPLWLLRRHPEWQIVLASYDGGLSGSWARRVRRIIEDHPDLGIALSRDGGAGSHWSTEEGGGVYSTSVRGALTGRGARVLVIDDPVKDFVDAHSLVMRQALWDWWLTVALTRLEPPYLVVVVMTRWHEDDMVGRLLSPDFEGDPADWETIFLPAIADRADDVLGRAEGEPLLSPLLTETPEQAVARWADVKRAVGTYTFSAMYQQRPAPARGAIFDSGWWRFWTMDQSRATEDGRVVYLDPSRLVHGRWLDSWDMSFKGRGPSDSGGAGSWVVGQRWVRSAANRFLISQVRGRWSFTQVIAAMERWLVTDDPAQSLCGHLVHERLVEDTANGPAIIDTLKEVISGLKPVPARESKEARARAITPEVESGNVYLPHPGDPGNEWVHDLLSELRNFPHDIADDQVDTLTQALQALRSGGRGQVTVPGRLSAVRPEWQVPRDIARAAQTDHARRRA